MGIAYGMVVITYIVVCGHIQEVGFGCVLCVYFVFEYIGDVCMIH